jgi:carbamoyl-phosphate synthase large subunit
MRPINVLVTACGCPGAATLIKQLRYYVIERNVMVFGVDCDDEAIGRFMADGFYQIPPVSETEAYLDAIRDTIDRCRIDVILPENDLEIPVLAEHRDSLGCPVLVSSPLSITLARDKHSMQRCTLWRVMLAYQAGYILRQPMNSLTPFIV